MEAHDSEADHFAVVRALSFEHCADATDQARTTVLR
jgi:hypothetical protein